MSQARDFSHSRKDDLLPAPLIIWSQMPRHSIREGGVCEQVVKLFSQEVAHLIIGCQNLIDDTFSSVNQRNNVFDIVVQVITSPAIMERLDFGRQEVDRVD
jgi:hypothetical protein